MAVDIPPSPRAEDVPEYAQRLREIQELSRKRSVHRRWRSKSINNEKAQAGRRGDRSKAADSGAASARWVRDNKRLQQNDEQNPRCQHTSSEDAPRRVGRKPLRHDDEGMTQRSEESLAKKITQQKGKTRAVKGSKEDSRVVEKAVVASIVASSVVSLFVALATQGLAHGGLMGPGALFGAVLPMIGMGS